MKNYFDSFYEIIHKNSVKRRRMISLLLVLSVFVSSGVLWELRDTVITMVNEPLCGIEEHVHTDECYEYRLVCGLEENEEHTHTEECYEKVLVCGYDEHTHTALCYTDDDLTVRNEPDAADDAEDTYAISNVIGDELLNADLPEIRLDNEFQSFDGEADQNAPYINPQPLTDTIDNIAEGIKFTLFDYGDSHLEANNNKYVYEWVKLNEETHEGIWTFPQSHSDEEEGWKDSGINSGRNPAQDILFFAMGTPVSEYCHNPDVYNYRDENGAVIRYKPDKNSYSGDYNATPPYTGNRPVSGIVNNTLTNGYPTLKDSGNSLDYLFAPTTTVDGVDQKAYKAVYKDVNYLLRKDGNNLFYNSNNNYAYYNKETGNFIVYDRTYPVINPDHHKSEDIDYHHLQMDENNNAIPTVYTDNKPEFKIGFFPFDQYDPTKRDPNFNGIGYDHHFGMTMEASFSNYTDMTAQSAEPIVFKYSGDDDMWVFVDGVLVLDIGGIHEPAAGMIDFTNGLVWTQDNALGDTAEEAYADLCTRTSAALPLFSNIPKPDNGVNTDESSQSKWNVTTIASKFAGIDGKSCGPNDGLKHEIKMFYLERGGCYSNLAMEMNLPTLKPLTVMKEVDYRQHLVKDDAIDKKDYNFQVWELIDGNWVIPNDLENSGEFTLKAGERKTFENLGQNRKFKVVEVGVDPDIFDQVKVNGVQVYPDANNNVSSNGDELKDVNSYTFNNRVIEETTDIKIKKVWDGNVPNDYDTVKYKIMRTDSSTGEVKQVALLESENNQTVKKRTFTIPSADWAAGVTKSGLLSRYGNHYYTYSVEELNVPTGFKASYSVDANGDLVITNTDMSKTDIYVKKNWENYNADAVGVKVKLTRSKIGYTSSTPTSLTINILDEGGNLIKTFETDNVYADGSAEIAYTLPEGVVIYRGDPEYPQKKIGDGDAINLPKNIICGNNEHTHTDECYRDDNTLNDTLYVKFEEDEGILVVQNLSASANTVTFKVTSDKAEDSLLLLHHSFTRGVNDWQPNGSVEIMSSGYNPYAKGDALYVNGRTKSWHGVKFYLDPAKFKANKTYTFSAYLLSPVATRFKMTFNNGLGNFKQISEPPISVNANEWTQVTGTIQLTDKIDPYNMYIVVETVPYGNDYDNAPIEEGGTYFRMDEFTAIEGNTPVSVDADTGVVTIGEAASSDRVVYYHLFNGLDDNWTERNLQKENGYTGSDRTLATGAPDNDPDGRYVRVWNRDNTGDGIQRQDVSFLQPGHTYRFEVGAQHAEGDSNQGAGADDVHLTLYVPGSGINNNNYNWVCNVSIPDQNDNHYAWGNGVGSEITIPDNADINGMYMYFETGSNTTNKYGPFRIRYVRVVEVGSDISSSGFTEPKAGYTINEHGQYVSDFSNYNISLDANSVTNPVHLADTGYQIDEGFSKTVVLDSSNTWKYHWQNHNISDTDEHYLSEDNAKYLYKYHIEEISIINSNNTETAIIYDNATNDWLSADENYIVSYSNNDVASNSVDNPMLITNRYIWYRLPATGGPGTASIYILGTLLTAIGILSGSALYRRKRRRV